MSIVFENIWLLLTVAGVALVIVSIIRQAKPGWGYGPLLVPAAIVGLAFALDAAVQTDTEAINDIIADSKKAAIAGDITTLMAHISPNYADSSYLSRDAIERKAKDILSRSSIQKIKTQAHLLTINTNSAQSEFKFVVHFNKDSQYATMGSLMFVGMTINYEKIGQTWYISSAEITSVNDQPWKW